MAPPSLAAHRGVRLALRKSFLLRSSLSFPRTSGRDLKPSWRELSKRNELSKRFARKSALARPVASTSATATERIRLVDVNAAAETPLPASRR